MKLVSVIIPVYNSEKYIAQCLDSILNNTYKNLEVICIDDGSKDRSASIIKQYQTEYPNIILISQENAGVSAARNAGLQIAKGEYISFVDSDDEISPIYFESLTNAIESTNSDIAACSYSTEKLAEDAQFTQKYEVYVDGDYYRIKQLKNYVIFKLYKRSLIDSVRFPPQLTFAEDIAFNVSALAYVLEGNKSITCAMTQDKMYYYRQVDTSLTHVLKCEDWIPLCNWLEQSAQQQSDEMIKSLLQYEALKKWLTILYESKQAVNVKSLNIAKKKLKKIRRKLVFIPHYMKPNAYISFKIFAGFPDIYVLYRKLGKR